MLSDQYLRIPLEQIHVRRDERQRRAIDGSDLEPSIRARGILNPLIVERRTDGSFNLIAGERRLTAARAIGLETVPCRLASELPDTERQIIELEENVKRKDLDWKDEARAVAKIHKLYTDLDLNWTQTQTAEAIGMSDGSITKYLLVSDEIDKANPRILACTGISAAYNILARQTSRAVDDVMNEFFAPKVETNASDFQGIMVADKTDSGVPAVNPARELESIHRLSFLEFAPSYSGAPFNFIHCDFPYGIGMQDSDQGKSDQYGAYDDRPEVYWELLGCLCAHLPKLMAPSSHLMFWFSMEYYHETLEFFEANAPQLEVQKFPLIWVKTDNRGILPDPTRGPRRIYETAFIASRGDRKIIRAVANAYPSPTTKEIHQSEKSEPMLRHFFQMFVDENTKLLDPTCGSGSALRAAESLGAQTTIGLEINEDYCKAANIALRKSRLLRRAS